MFFSAGVNTDFLTVAITLYFTFWLSYDLYLTKFGLKYSEETDFGFIHFILEAFGLTFLC